jgi:signal transduction histidine kinase/ActR/RegA family two-component response regulator
VGEVLEEGRLGAPGFPAQPQTQTQEALLEYNEVVFRKLQKKVVQLQDEIAARQRAEAERESLLKREQEARAEAEAANRAKDDFLAIISHELRTPLTAILGWGWLLSQSKLSDQERQNAIDIILRNMENQRQIVDDLIDVSSYSRGQFKMAHDTIELGAALELACEALSQTAQKRGIRFVRDVHGPVGVLGDAGRLQQVFANLLQNAVKFSPVGSEIRVSLRRDGDEGVVAVQDEGQGIPADFLPRLFERFRQKEDPLIREHGGLGLGLAIVKFLVERHGGTVSGTSAGEGRGATFTVRLPVAVWPPAGPLDPAVGRAARGCSLEGLSVLVVEDEAGTRRMLQLVLESCGGRVNAVCDAESAWLSLQKDLPDVILCDIALPGEDGCALMRRVRSRGGALAAVPAAALTALAREEDRLRALKAGFQCCLAKPLEPPFILAALRDLAAAKKPEKK